MPHKRGRKARGAGGATLRLDCLRGQQVIGRRTGIALTRSLQAGSSSLFEREYDELETAVHTFKNLLAVLKAKQTFNLCVPEQQVAQALGPQVGVNTAGYDDATVPTRTQEVEAAFDKQLVEVQVCTDLATIHHRKLLLILRGRPKILVDVRESIFIRKPRGPHFGVLQQLALLFLKLLDGHFVFADHTGILGKKLFGLRLEHFPRRVGQDDVKATALLHDVVKHIAPVEGRLGSNVGHRHLALFGLAQVFFLRVPLGFFKLDTQGFKLVAQQLVHHAAGVAHFHVDAVAQLTQVQVLAQLVCRISVGGQVAVFLFHQAAVGGFEKVVLLAVELMFIHAHQPYQRVAGQDVEVDIGQGLQVFYLAHAGHHGEKEAQLGNLAGLFHDVHTMQVVGDDAALDVIAHAGVVFFDGFEPLLQLCTSTQLGTAHHGVVHIDKAFERGHQKCAGAHRRVQDGDAGQHFVDQLEGGACVHTGQQVGHGVELDLFDV